VDVEERSSLSNINKEGALSREAYSFPVIHIENASNGKMETGENDSFQRIVVDEKGKLSLDGPEQKAARIEEEAYARGFSKGEKDGLESGKEKLEPVLRNFREALLRLEEIKKEIYLNAEKDIVDLVLAITKKIVCHEITSNKEVILGIVKEAIKKVVDHEEIKIRISPSDLQVLKNARTELSNLVDNIQGVTLEEDETILHGGCIIETTSGDIDARVEKQLEAVEEALKSELKE
jgi:flagellar assembly protein FliH